MENTTDLIQQIIILEWTQFSTVNNVGGKAQCQNDLETFALMRAAQARIWQEDTLKSYLKDLHEANNHGINLMSEKYAHMMATTHPDEYQAIKSLIEPIPAEKYALVELILFIFEQWEQALKLTYPNLRRAMQKEHTPSGQEAADSTLTYLRGELLSYSPATLNLCLRDVANAKKSGHNLSQIILSQSLQYYGYDSLADFEARFKTPRF